MCRWRIDRALVQTLIIIFDEKENLYNFYFFVVNFTMVKKV